MIETDGTNLTFIVNPLSRGYSPEFGRMVRERWPLATLRISSSERDLYIFGKEAVAGGGERVPVVVACGGDGTFAAVASAVGREGVLGIIPLGTVNLVASQLGIPGKVQDALDLLASGKPVPVFPGCCSWDREEEPRYFFIGVSVGVDADSVNFVSRKTKVFLRGYAYAVSFMRRLLFFPLPEATYAAGNERGRCNALIVTPSRFYGGGHVISDRQSLFAPGIEAICIHPGKMNSFLFFISLFSGSRRIVKYASVMVPEEVVLSAPSSGRFQLDGDVLTAKEVRIRATDKPLSVIAGRQ
jgi:diacylglycerol kinase (ATP)